MSTRELLADLLEPARPDPSVVIAARLAELEAMSPEDRAALPKYPPPAPGSAEAAIQARLDLMAERLAGGALADVAPADMSLAERVALLAPLERRWVLT